MVELVPVKNPLIALAVDDNVPSSAYDTILATPILNRAGLWYPELSRYYWLSTKATVSPEFNAAYKLTLNKVPALLYTTGKICTLPNPLTLLPAVEL